MGVEGFEFGFRGGGRLSGDPAGALVVGFVPALLEAAGVEGFAHEEVLFVGRAVGGLPGGVADDGGFGAVLEFDFELDEELGLFAVVGVFEIPADGSGVPAFAKFGTDAVVS